MTIYLFAKVQKKPQPESHGSSRFSLHNQLVEIPLTGNGVHSFFYMRRPVGFTNSQLVHAAA
jgi:hypothetical protein